MATACRQAQTGMLKRSSRARRTAETKAALSTSSNSRAHVESNQWTAAAPPPFTLKEVRQAIPARCFERSALRSTLYLVADCAGVAALAALTISKPSHPLILLPYTVAQGTLFWSLFVVGHDCGHGSYSSSKRINNWVGHFTHSFLLVPFHPWRISHAKVCGSSFRFILARSIHTDA